MLRQHFERNNEQPTAVKVGVTKNSVHHGHAVMQRENFIHSCKGRVASEDRVCRKGTDTRSCARFYL